mmetsp:Transcript_20465/g.31004  ORF Transcript_20465/g.31004 Transcript_20465/m.31004 type:complete len:229 (+) Transcript_20465:31-717(+)
MDAPATTGMITGSSELLSLLLPPWLLGSCAAVAAAMTVPVVGEFTSRISIRVSTKSIFAFVVSSLGGSSLEAFSRLAGSLFGPVASSLPLVLPKADSVVTSSWGLVASNGFTDVVSSLTLVSSIGYSESIISSFSPIAVTSYFASSTSTVVTTPSSFIKIASSLVMTSNSTLHVLPIKSPASHTIGCNFFNNPALFASTFMACTKYCVSSRESGTSSQYISLNVTVPL